MCSATREYLKAKQGTEKKPRYEGTEADEGQIPWYKALVCMLRRDDGPSCAVSQSLYMWGNQDRSGSDFVLPACLRGNVIRCRHRHAAGLQRDLSREVHQAAVQVGLQHAAGRLKGSVPQGTPGPPLTWL